MHTEQVIYRHPWGETVNVTAIAMGPRGEADFVLTSLSRPSGCSAYAGWVFDLEERVCDRH